ncbi:MAG: hypothetical protein JWQ00_2507, partial [Noviherbaspirillum sp.]|nr:hypothetical protein [Noviherbaspirillum sp.]
MSFSFRILHVPLVLLLALLLVLLMPSLVQAAVPHE